MKVKDLILKLDNSGIQIKFYESDHKTLIYSIEDNDKIKNAYKSGQIGEIFNRNIKYWEINGHGECISIILKPKEKSLF